MVVCLLGSCSIQTRVKRADKKFAIGEYYDAAEVYRSCYSRLTAQKDRPLKAQVAFRQAECYRVLNNPRAITSYQHAIKYKYPDSIAYLRLAQVQHYQGKYRDAEKNYRIYLQSHPDDYVAMAGVYAAAKAAEWKKQPTRHKVVAVKEFNANRSSNFAPAFIGDDADAMMFTSNRKQNNTGGKKVLRRPSPVTGKQTFSLYTTRRDASGKWQEIHLPDGLYGEEEEETKQENDSTQNTKSQGSAEMGVCCFTSDGKTMYFTFSRPINGQDQGTKIYRTERTGGEWGEPQEVKLFADSSISVGHPAVSAHGDTLYFVSDAPNGQGGKDIWRAEAAEGQWINVVNMGPQINTSGDEMFPAIRKDGRLYFSSNGHPGYGGLDIFCASPTGQDTAYIISDSVLAVRLPQYSLMNMGMPLNSIADDFGMTFESSQGKEEKGFFSSNRASKKGEDQIFRFILPEMVLAVEGKVTDMDGNALSDATLRLIGTDGTNQKLLIRRDGTYRLKLQPNTQYLMFVTSRGYLNQKYELKTEEKKDSYTYTQNFTLASLNKPVPMNNVFYEFGKWELTESSSKELLDLVKMLNDNPYITIELSAHTDMVGDSVANRTLSEKRAQACVDFLIKQGIEKERLTPVGYGESKPVVADKALHDKYRFIPVEQVLDETFLNTLTKEQQETCNQINRRTEFRVLKTTYKLY
ncbi:MAG: PD40 domain-containing protein [Paludibacteraceae bacterium]|nr:PD40 domain-containing protein [Paludibacteraceae bacterium]